MIRNFTTGATSRLGNISVSTNNFVIAGDGQAAWFHRADGRLVREDLAGGQALVASGQHAWIDSRSGASVAGAFNRLYGGGFGPAGNRG